MIEICLIIFKFNDSHCPSKQEKYLDFKGFDFSKPNVFKMVAHLYLLIEFIKKHKATPNWLTAPGLHNNDFTKFIPRYILYYIESNKEQIFCECAEIIFDVFDIFYEVTPAVFHRKFLFRGNSIGRTEDGSQYYY